MKNFILAFVCLANILNLQGQCNERYGEEIFNEVSISTVTYSDVHNLQMDIYQAVGDTETQRPLLIFAHGGAFIDGNRTNSTMTALGAAFAKRGYVVASISYRLMSVIDLFNSETALNGVARALSDGRAAVRYFRKTVALQSNPYGIDENQIYFGGSSAGGVIALHSAFMQVYDITDPALLAALNALGGIEGNSGNDGYSSEVRGAISLAGAIADVNFITIDENDQLLISCHGDVDDVLPYLCGQPLSNAGLPSSGLPELCGGGAILAYTESIDFNNHHHLLLEGAGHAPWVYNLPSQNQMINYVSENLYNSLDCFNLGCTSSSADNYNPQATIDDGSCYIEGCISEDADNYDASATEDDDSCEWLDCIGDLSYTPLNIYIDDSLCQSNLYCEDFNWDGGDCVLDCNDNLMTLWDIDIYFYNVQCDDILNCMFYNFDNESCLESEGCEDVNGGFYQDGVQWSPEACTICTCENGQISCMIEICEFPMCEFPSYLQDECCPVCLEVDENFDCSGISITLFDGWNIIGFTCSENTNASLAFSNIEDKIVIAKDAFGNAYLPDFDFNGIGDLERGYGYLIKVTEQIDNYNICE